ncbi:ParH-like protein [Streptomyces sp. C10-9-1]|uniref:ParH-like protein n=1 Tax=Streptomyces sp. C10-9-1 TaxID=1859285 RepID=UPI002111D5A9|nr:ParH-like protein [Streptomyces sp. C10-9-1]MCQ6553193.1 ParH-like protein [Streptomyces sp. C10-9-1]
MLLGRPDRRMWRRAGRIVDGLAVPTPFDATRFIASLAERRGRPITVLPVDLPSTGPCGVLVTTDSADYILHTRQTTALHREHILLHEAAHLLLGHDRVAGGDPAVPRALVGHLSPHLVRRVLGRTAFPEPAEREAELLASLLRHRALRKDAALPPPVSGGSAAGPLVGGVVGLRDRG